MTRMALQFWGHDRLIVNNRAGWQLRDWPSGEVVQEGVGVAAPQPGGDLLAVCDAGAVTVDGRQIATPRDPVHLVSWYNAQSLVVVCGENAMRHVIHGAGHAITALPVPDEGPTAQVQGSYSDDAHEIWLVPIDGSPRRLRVLDPLGQVFSARALGDGTIGVTEYVVPMFGGDESWRSMALSLDGRCEDLLSDVAGYVNEPMPSPDGSAIGLCTSEDVGWWFDAGIIRGAHVHRPFPPTTHVGAGWVWSADGRLIVLAYEGLRIGALIEGSDQPLIAPSGTVHDVALQGDGDGAATYNALGDQPALHRITADGLAPIDPVESAGTSAYEIVSWESDGHRLEGILALPHDVREPLPLVVWVRGGPSIFHTEHAPELDEWTSRGFAALAVNYRSSGMAGRQPMIDDFTAEIEAHGEGTVRDILAGVSAVESREEIDAQRVYAIGHSYGGYCVNRLVTRSHRMRAAVSWESNADLVLLDRLMGGNAMYRRCFGGNPSTTDRFAASSPIYDVAAVQTPILLLAGENQMLKTMIPWYTALRDAGVTSELVVYRDEGHMMSRPANQQDLYDRAAAWFRRFS